jgi:hypothetical protein
VLGRQFQASERSGKLSASDHLKLLEDLYARFSGVRAPRKIDEVI